jgi:signal transduction histidine kinase
LSGVVKLRRGRSLRLKLTVWFVLVFCLLQTALVGGVVLMRRESIRRSLEDDLARSAKDMVDSLLTSGQPLEAAQLQGLLPARANFLLVAVRDHTGKVLSSWNLARPEDLPFSNWEEVPAGPIGPVFTSLTEGRAARLGSDEPLRLVTLPFRPGATAVPAAERADAPDEERVAEGFSYFQAAVRDRVLEDLLGPLDLAVLGAPLVAAAVASWLIGGRAVAPIQRLSRAVRELSPRSFSARFKTRSTDAEVARLEDELNSALERLEGGYRAQAQFISNVSHELKTPIAVLLTEAQVAKLEGKSPERSSAFVDMAEREMKRLGNLVESLLILARTDMNKNRLTQPVSVNDLLLEAVQHCRLLAEQHRVRLVANLVADDIDPTVMGDPQLLQVMVENLVRNAIRHSPAGAPVAIEAHRTGEQVSIAVRDEGPGIPEEYRDRIFDRGVRVPSANGAKGSAVGPDAWDGAGLGLAIARNVAQLHKGGIRLEPNAGGGCAFLVDLPLARRDEDSEDDGD